MKGRIHNWLVGGAFGFVVRSGLGSLGGFTACGAIFAGLPCAAIGVVTAEADW